MLIVIQGLVSIMIMTHRYSLIERHKNDTKQGTAEITLDRQLGRNLKR